MAIETNSNGAVKNELLLAAVIRGELSTVKRLLDRGAADINAKNKAGLNSLQLAIIHRHFKLGDYLIQKGVDFHSRDPQGWCALHDAALMDCKVLVRKLISKGCSPTVTNDHGELPIDVAGSVEMERLLCEEMNLKGEKKLAHEYYVYLGLKDLRDSEFLDSDELDSRQLPSLSRYRNRTATPRNGSSQMDQQLQDQDHCRRVTRSAPDLEHNAIDRLHCVGRGQEENDPEENSQSRLRDAVIDRPSYSSSRSTYAKRETEKCPVYIRTHTVQSSHKDPASQLIFTDKCASSMLSRIFFFQSSLHVNLI